MARKKTTQPWVCFYYENKFLGGYSVKGTFEGELEITRELFAFDCGCPIEDIKVKQEVR